MIRRLGPFLLAALTLLLSCPLHAQLQAFGRIIGQIRIARGDVPPHQILVELQHRGAAMDDVYSDAQGHFGFLNLPGGEYHVIVNDEDYFPVDERVNVNPDVNPYTMVQISLRARENVNKGDPIGSRASGGNPYLVDPSDYSKRFPKKALKEYERGVDAERKGKHDEAIAHYLDALKIAPDYYPAHNNLGSLYLGKADFKSAEEQFQEAVRLDPNDAQAYFNLGNVLMLIGHYPASEMAVSSGLQRRPDSAFGHFLQGCLDGRTGKLPEAEKNLRTALKLDSTMWQAHLQLVGLYVQQQQRELAITELQVFLKAFPSVPAVPKAKDLLHRLQSGSAPVHPL
jgi:TolA-binding protein